MDDKLCFIFFSSLKKCIDIYFSNESLITLKAKKKIHLKYLAENAQYIAICIAIRPCRIVSYRNTPPAAIPTPNEWCTQNTH